MELRPCADLRGYFHERLQLAQSRLSQRTDEQTEHYLVEMLARFGLGEEDVAPDAPLVLLLNSAGDARDPREQLRRFRVLGDVALYASGFFPESLTARGVTERYATEIGKRAYGTAASIAYQVNEPQKEVLPALDREFLFLVVLLKEAREAPIPQGPAQIVELFKRWRETGDAKIAAGLRAAGVDLTGTRTVQ